MKKCSKCNKQKTRSEFHKNSYAKDGLHGQCKECRLPYACKKAKEWANNNKEKRKEWLERNKESIKKYGKEYYKRNKKSIRAYQKKI